jgi:hypothetical protein
MVYCKICEANTKIIVDHKTLVSYFRCKECGFIFLDEQYIISSNKEKQHYEKHNNSFECTGYVKMFTTFIQKAIDPYLFNIKTSLDFGCGNGAVLSELLKQKNIKNDKYDLFFYPDESYKLKQYDLITSTEVFEHLSKPFDILDTLIPLLNKNGYLILMTKFPPKSDKEFINWWYRRDITHIVFFTPKSFEIIALKYNLNLLSVIDDNIVVFQK